MALYQAGVVTEAQAITSLLLGSGVVAFIEELDYAEQKEIDLWIRARLLLIFFVVLAA
jgi:hypothetical protein